MRKAIVIINEQHSLMEDQVRILNEQFELFESFEVPASGWTLNQQMSILSDMREWYFDALVFASPVPAMLKEAVEWKMAGGPKVFVFHNDNREKKELPGGKIVMTVAKTGWVLV